MRNLIIVRHGQSTWNADNKFTGWVDAPLSSKGIQEAEKAGQLIKEFKGINFYNMYGFTSFLSRAIETLKIIIYKLEKEKVIIQNAWQLNERHYGSLTGLNKKETKDEIGEELFFKYRRSWNIAPPKIDDISKKLISGKLFNTIPSKAVPLTESLEDTYNRVIPYFEKNIAPLLQKNNIVIIAAHGNSLRALCKKIFKINQKDINSLEIPTGNPMLISMNDNWKVKKATYMDAGRSKHIIIN